jgi:non-ribosomal peptide synthetase component F
VFPCVATLPSLCVLAGSNQELAFNIQKSNSQMFKHQHTPLRSIQKWLGHAEQSLFDTIFVYQKGEVRQDEIDFAWKVVQEDAFVDYSISLELEPTARDSLLIRATCKDNIMPREQTELLLRQFQAALIDILESPDSPSTDFFRFPKETLSCTLAKEDEIPTDVRVLHGFVEKHRQLVPDKVAYEFATSIEEGCAIKETWSYTQLDKEGNKVANYLLDHGSKTGDIIGVCFEKCPEASFAILGILKAGCAFVALDYNAPIERKSFIISDSKAKHVLTMDKFASELSSKLDANVVSMQSGISIKTASTDTPEIPDLKPTDLCYCLYTSGTTGTPKGCELTHENAVQAMLAFQRLFSPHWGSESRFLQFASFHFDVSVLEQFWSWSVGICVTSAPRDLIFQDLALAIRELRITHLDLTPSLASLIKPEDAPLLCKGVFITGGEQLKQEILDAWGERGCIYNG